MLHSDWGLPPSSDSRDHIIVMLLPNAGHASSFYGCASSDTLDEFDNTSWVVVLHSYQRRTSFTSRSCFLTAVERSRDQIGMDEAKLQDE